MGRGREAEEGGKTAGKGQEVLLPNPVFPLIPSPSPSLPCPWAKFGF